MTGAALPKNKREIKSDLFLSKRGKVITINEFYNIPCFNEMPFLFAPLIDDWASLP